LLVPHTFFIPPFFVSLIGENIECLIRTDFSLKILNLKKFFNNILSIHVIPHSEVEDKPERGIGETHSAIGGSDSVGSAATLNGP